jgi:putative transposase
MPHSFVHLLVHIIFSTKGRAADLTPEVSDRLFPYIGGIVRQLGAVPWIVNGPADHVHLLLKLPATASLAEVMRVVKANSSRWLHEQYPTRKHFGWQSGYAAFTVSASRANEVSNYIRSQQEHHRKLSFQEEFLMLLQKHGLEYDARDVWG